MSVLRYPGGKTKALKQIVPLIPQDCVVLYSPFFGGGSVEITTASRPIVEKVVANDKFSLLINFWNNVQEHPIEIQKRLRSYNVTKDVFHDFRKKITNVTDNIEQASYYFAINRCSFSGATFCGGFSEESSKKRFTTNSIDKISKIDLKKFEFHSYDVIDFLRNCVKNEEKHYIYADPPYLLEKGNKLYGNKGDLHEQFVHQLFHDELVKYDRWILSYNDCPKIREMYSGYKISTLSWKYGMNSSKISSEIIIMK